MRLFVYRMPFLNKVIYSWFVREKYSFVNYLFGIGTTIEQHTSDYRR